jgi:fluoride exporter
MELRRAMIVMAGGALGAYARYAVGGWFAARYGPVFPWGTLVINLAGSFVLGLFVGARDSGHYTLDPVWTLLFAIGFLGAFTTFSTFTVETMHLITLRSFILAGANVLGSVALGLLAAGLGLLLGRAV